MTLRDKYKDVLDTASRLPLREASVREEGQKLLIKGTCAYQLDKDVLWDKIKAREGWKKEVEADIKVEKTDIYGVYTVQEGDTLSGIAKRHLGNANRYMEIFNLNRDVLTNPDLIRIGQNLKLPNKQGG